MESICAPFRTTFGQEISTNGFLADYYKAMDTDPDCTSVNSKECWERRRRQVSLIEADTHWLFEYYTVKALSVLVAALKTLHTNQCGRC